MASNCISLSGSASCSAFSSASISTDRNLTGLFPFLTNVTDVRSFDSGLQNYIANNFVQSRYQTTIGCSSIDLSNTTDLYARYTTSVLCNAIVQNSITPCLLSGDAIRPLCADTCADYAISEQSIVASPQLCGSPGPNANKEILADYTNCWLPNNSLSRSECIEGVQNEPDDCGFEDNLTGLCSFCADSPTNGTDSCCLFSNATSRCSNVHLPITTSMPPLFTNTPSSTPSATGASKGLTGGQIAGIVVGSVLGALLLLAILIGCCLLIRRRRHSQQGSVFNQPSPSRTPGGAPAMTYHDGPSGSPTRYGIIGGRVARMSALERGDDEPQEYADSPESGLPGPPPKRSGSLSSGSHLGAIAAAGMHDSSSPQSNSNGEYSSPEGVGSGQSEQLTFFKDYYSQDEIRPGDKVAVLWAYQPRANDEFELDRGDMLKVVGIWDDGWATGVRLSERAEEWEDVHNPQRDSGMSNGSSRDRDSPTNGEIKAFPLVCVCLPQHWRKTIEGESGDTAGGSEDLRRPPSP